MTDKYLLKHPKDRSLENDSENCLLETNIKTKNQGLLEISCENASLDCQEKSFNTKKRPLHVDKELYLSEIIKDASEKALDFRKDLEPLDNAKSLVDKQEESHRKYKTPSIVKEQTSVDRKYERERIRMNQIKTCIQNQNVSDVVRRYYNERPEVGKKRRESSPIIGLRNFNNWVKSALIRRFTKEFPKNIPLIVLDIGCGKGGDLLKWSKAGVAGYIGIDSAEVSIMQARERFRKIKNLNFAAKFYVLDCYMNSLETVLPPDERKFDIVSMQFCMHYAFETEEKCHQMLSNVSKSLIRGGKFIGTIPNSDFIIEKIKKLKNGKKDWGNSIYRVQFINLPSSEFRPPFGHRYSFYLEDAVTNVPEYVVPFEAFRALALDYDLEMLYCKRFHDIFFEEQKDYEIKMLLERMNLVDNQGKRLISDDEWDTAGFYLAFAFEKRGF
ncbi:hypothetical protein PNEG_02068 [Pneumocystis murina B123]|uniref:mRNA cap guanine-N(7) methyltransferase n=1 Tax=Pneumocystis murina (strain B123) TaxID=1069680 RepID=M7NQU6_PNEMU|nr:hypothetical protein PNEG_02068 [Pneumocystis murina B123]EMR09481.1 hypothetical protein PNEG_02068 [Pneumocystis murina B123]